MGIFHKFVSAAADDINADLVRPISDWDDDHTSPAHVLLAWGEQGIGPGSSWADQPAAETRFFNDQRSYRYADLRFATQVRIVVDTNVAGASGAELRVQYSLDAGLSWLPLGPAVSIAGVGVVAGAWATVAAATRIENALIRLSGINGNGVADPRFRSVSVQFR
jgi:hypothetical protein